LIPKGFFLSINALTIRLGSGGYLYILTLWAQLDLK
jgi:hypothetical protein